MYPNLYVWYIFASSLDIMLTYAIVFRLGGVEVNAVAAHLVEKFQHWGLIGLKFSTVLLVVGVCEIMGRKHERAGRRLAITAIVISSLPVGYGIVQLLAWLHFGGEGT